ncbi:MAG: family 16 glycoside hydrolase [Balneolales bacterium]
MNANFKSTLFCAAVCLVMLNAAAVSGQPDRITSLPLTPLSLVDLDAFRSPDQNWQIVGGVRSDLEEAHSMIVGEGSGVIANLPAGQDDGHLFTRLEHGDMELRVEFLVPQGSNSGIYFQGRYEAQIMDSWGVDVPGYEDLGGIYQRWDDTRPDGQQGFEGYAPGVNAAMAPGLWQEYHILFRAPRFDENGNKISNAEFEWVYLNGMLVQQNAEVSGPTRASAFDDEVPTAPLMIQGDHGPVAFRNFQYKAYSLTDSLALGELDYSVYDFNGDRVPDFDDLGPPIHEGITDSFNVESLSPKTEHYAMRFRGDLHVPVSGDYLFETQIANGGDLYIDGGLIVGNNGDGNFEKYGGVTYLEQGVHELELTYMQVVSNAHVVLAYEGPGIEKRALASVVPESGGPAPERLTVQPGSRYPELIGGFVNYGNEKRVHTLSVGHPEGVHYSYDLNRAALLNFWNSPFADVTGMWQGRGGSQLLAPMNASVEDGSGIPLASLGTEAAFMNQEVPDQLTGKEYNLNEAGRPVFSYQYGNVSFTDEILPSANRHEGLERKLIFHADTRQGRLAGRVAQGKEIERLNNGLYRVNGRYYIRIKETSGEEAQLLDNGLVKALFVPVLRRTHQSTIEYQLIW